MSYTLLAVDPGESWCGLAVFELFPVTAGYHPQGGRWLGHSRNFRICLERAETLRPPVLYRTLETLVATAYHLVMERYALYPWLAREQGYSELETAQCVGVVKYICGKADLPVTLQDAKGNLKEGREIASKAGFDMVPRALGSGRYRYRGPDFNLPGMPHRRDACAHGVVWSARNPASPLVRRRDQAL